MFDIGWTEMMVVAIVAILFVGPKELPGMLRSFGKGVKKIRMLAGDFQRQFDDALKDAELDGVKASIDSVRNLDPTKAIKDKLNPLKSELDSVKESVEKSNDFDPETLFDESKAPAVDPAVKVDVDAALDRQKKMDEDFAKVAPSSGKNAVPGFGGPAAEQQSAPDADAAASDKAVSTKSKAAKSTAAKPKSAKPAAARTKTASGSTAKQPAAKPAPKKAAPAKTASAASKKKPATATKRKPTKKAQA